ncbi:hypothetical protein TNCV_3448801 [Trichonephila clavipes]|nr:hypothetical protein TNCV_3448801 [Trichonephila clavipes]
MKIREQDSNSKAIDLIPSISNKVTGVSEIRTQIIVPHSEMHSVLIFGVPTLASSDPEGGHYGYPALSEKFTGIWDFLELEGIFGSAVSKCVCVPTSASYTGTGVCKYYGRLALSGKVFGTPKNWFQILIPDPETHTEMSFDTVVRASSVATWNENSDERLECKNVFHLIQSNILQSYGSF